MLQSVLHCLAQQMHILGKNVELRGSLTALPTLRSASQTVAVSEFIVETDTDKKVMKRFLLAIVKDRET